MKRVIAITLCLILLMAVPLFAQTPRQPTSSEGKTGLTNLAVTGLNQSGVPGYIEMLDGDGVRWYLYVSTSGLLILASDITVGYGASPSLQSWESPPDNRGFAGTIVGIQTAP